VRRSEVQLLCQFDFASLCIESTSLTLRRTMIVTWLTASQQLWACLIFLYLSRANVSFPRAHLSPVGHHVTVVPPQVQNVS
jgi:hypothetical protein